MFGKKTKELQNRVTLLESEVKRLNAILEFLTYKKKNSNQMTDVDIGFDAPPALQSKLGEVLISGDCAQKIDKLAKMDIATKDDIARIDSRFLEIFNTISGLFAHLGKSKEEEITL